MNILHTNFHKHEGGGHTTYILTMLRNPEHTHFVACPSTSLLYQTLQERGFPNLIPIEFPGKPKHYREILSNTLKLRRAILEHGIDIVHTNGSNDNRMALYASLLTRKRFKVVYTKHNTIRIKNAVSRLRLRRFNDAVIFVADVMDRIGLDRDDPRFHIIGNGIDLEYWKRSTRPVTDARLTLISNAGAARHKGWHHLMEAIAGLDQQEKDRLRVVMLGRYEEEMARELAEAPTVCDFHFPGYLDDQRPEMEQADIGFVLSYKEACSFACRELMAMSLPVITSDYPTLICNYDQTSGWVTTMKDAKSIREALRRILTMPPEALTAMKLAARARAEQEFSVETMIEKTNQVYAGLAG